MSKVFDTECLWDDFSLVRHFDLVSPILRTTQQRSPSHIVWEDARNRHGIRENAESWNVLAVLDREILSEQS